MKNRIRILMLISCFVILIVTVAFGGACAGQSVSSAYYLSLESDSWQTYNSEENIPENLLFTKSGDLYTLNIDLEAGEQFTVNRVNSSEKYGYSALFSALGKLVSGDNGSIKVSESGTYALSLSVSDGTLTYSFTAKEEDVTLTSVSVTYSVAQMYVNDSYTFIAAAYYSDGTTSGSGITWSSDNEAVATVSQSGEVKAIAVGSAKITAACGEYSASVDVTVSVATVPVTGVTLDKSELALEKGDSATLTATVAPADATNQAIFWSSSDSSIVTVSNGAITAVSYGTATVTVTTANGGYVASCVVTVIRHVDSIKLSTQSLTLVANGNAKELSVTFNPSTATYQSFTYAITSGSDYITVNEKSGALIISGIAAGTAEITVTSVDNPEATATCQIEVVASGTVLVDITNDLQIIIGEQADLTVMLENAEIESVEWSADNSVVSLSSEGGTTVSVTGNVFGTAAVSAVITDTDGKTYTVTCSVLVAEEYYFIYGVNLGAYNWDYQDYVNDSEAADEAGLLFEEVSTGVYQLTRSLDSSIGFQIIFPNVASYTDASGAWNMDIKDTYTYYDADSSDDAYVSNKTDQFMVNTAGVYTITLDLTGSIARVYINLVSVDVTNAMLTIESGNAALKNTYTTVLSITVAPEGATLSEDSLNVWLTSDYDSFETYTSFSYDFETMTVEVKCIKNPKQTFTVTVHCEIGGFETTIDLVFLPASVSVVAVGDISFDDDAYYINANNGGGAWTTTVSAHVNSDATSQGVIYSSDDENITVNAATGEVTASAFGTFTVIATAVGDSSVSATVELTVYSDSFYVIGYVYDTLYWGDPDALSQAATTAAGTLFEDYVFTDSGDHKTFTLVAAFNSGDYFQIVYLGMDDNWTNALTAEYFNSSKSNYSAAFETYNVKISSSGIYTITVDLSGSEPSFTIVYKEAILSRITLSLGDDQSAAVSSGDEFTVTVTLNPTAVYPEESEISWSVSDSGYVSVTFDYETMTAKVKVLDEGDSNQTVYITCTIRGVEGVLELVVLAAGEEEVLPTTIAFTETEYYFNVNNGNGDWTTTVSASVNGDATIQQVTYSAVSSNITVNANTGAVTGKYLGTYTVKATAAGDKSVTATCTVTFYSDQFYLIGEYSGEYGSVISYNAISQSSTTTSGTVFESYTFTMNSYTSYTLEVELNVYTALKVTESGTVRDSYGFQIAFIGMDSSFTGALTTNSSYMNYSGCYNYSSFLTLNLSNVRITKAATYIIEIDLSGSVPRWTINCKDTELSEILLDADSTELYNGDTAQISVSFGPSFTSAAEDDMEWSLSEGGSEYLGYEFDYQNLTVNVTVKSVKFSEDVTVTLTCTVGDITAYVEFTVKALHRLYYVYDDTEHWLVCSDDGCNYESEHETHKQGENYTCDANGHWYQCEICGGNHVNYEAHFTLTEGWYEGDGICSVCGFSLFDIDEDGTLTAYYGEIEKLVIPSSVNGITVTALGASLFAHNAYLKEVVMPDSITTVGNFLFNDCANLTSVTLSTGITKISLAMFQNCTALASINLHEGIITIDAQAFYGCSSLTEIAIPNSVSTIGSIAFSYMSATVVWGDSPSVTSISSSCFAYYLGTSIVIPSSVTSIRSYAFEYSNITSIIIPDSVSTLYGGVFIGCTSLKYAVFGAKVTNIQTSMFTNCTALEYVVFKNTEFWGEYGACFSGCTSLKAVFYGTDVNSFSGYDWLIHGDEDLLKGLCYAYYESNPGFNADYSIWADYFAGTWYYNDDGNIVIWENGEVFVITT